MNNLVIIKGNTSGITVILNGELPFDELLEEIKKKFLEASKFFKNAKMALTFEGRKLSVEEEYRILEIISENSQLEILCIMDEDKEKDRLFQTAIENKISSHSVANTGGQFYKGTLRSGQVVESEGSITILGDVNPGGKVIATGNIIILGSLKGTAFAGITGNMNSFVVALEMSPLQIRIGDVIARSSDGRGKKISSVPMIAYVENDNIFVEPLNKEVIDDINFI